MHPASSRGRFGESAAGLVLDGAAVDVGINRSVDA
jgi:hypothetical protein